MAGSLAEGLGHNAACIPWIQERYRAGAEIAGLCTAALFIADAGLVSDEHCSAHWFVDAAFRHEFSHINLMIDRTAPAEAAISSTGAYSFFQRLLERAGGHALASMCSASFSTVVFTNCSAGTKNHAFNMNGGIVTEIVGAGGANLTTSSILSDTRGLVKWLKSS